MSTRHGLLETKNSQNNDNTNNYAQNARTLAANTGQNLDNQICLAGNKFTLIFLDRSCPRLSWDMNIIFAIENIFRLRGPVLSTAVPPVTFTIEQLEAKVIKQVAH